MQNDRAKPRFDLKMAFAALTLAALWLGYFQAVKNQVPAIDYFFWIPGMLAERGVGLPQIGFCIGMFFLFSPIIFLTHYISIRLHGPNTSRNDILGATFAAVAIPFILFIMLLPPY